jgi:hypothetical protein
MDGTKMLRTITQTKSITFERKKAEQALDYGVLAQHSNVQAAMMAERGDYYGAIQNNETYKVKGDMASFF